MPMNEKTENFKRIAISWFCEHAIDDIRIRARNTESLQMRFDWSAKCSVVISSNQHKDFAGWHVFPLNQISNKQTHAFGLRRFVIEGQQSHLAIRRASSTC